MIALRCIGWLMVLGLPVFSVGQAASTDSGWLHDLAASAASAAPALLAVLLPGLVAAWMATGVRGLGAGLGWIGGVRDEARAALAARALASGARATITTGLVLAIAGLAYFGALAATSAQTGEFPAPARVAGGLSAGLVPPMFALLAGRCVLGASAADAARRAGERPGRTQRGWSEVSIPLLLVLLPALLLLSTQLDLTVIPD